LLGRRDDDFSKVVMLAPLFAFSAVASLVFIRKAGTDTASKLICTALVGAIIFIPFFLEFVSPKPLPYRSFVAVPFVLWLLLCWASRAIETKRLSAVLVILLSLVVFKQWQGVNELFYATTLTREHDALLAGRLADALDRALPETLRGCDCPLPLLVKGALRFENDSQFNPGKAVVGSTAAGSFFEWDGGSSGRIGSYLHLLGVAYLVPADSDTEARFKSDVEKMPVWPAQGFVAYKKGVVLIHLPEHR
jgi:hypothetical protein